MAWEIPITVDGRTFNARFDSVEEPTEQDIQDVVEHLKDPARGQTLAEGMGAGLEQGFQKGLTATFVSGPGAVASAVGLGDNFLLESGRALERSIEADTPISRENQQRFPVKASQAVGQAASMLVTAPLAGADKPFRAASMIGKTRQIALMGGFAGASAGEEEAVRLDITDPLAKSAMILGVGSVEFASEKLGGFGVETALPNVIRSLAGGRRAVNLPGMVTGPLTEGLEEIGAGVGSRSLGMMLAEEDPQNPGRTIRGEEIFKPWDLGHIAEEGALGTVAGTVMTSASHALNRLTPQQQTDTKNIAGLPQQLRQAAWDALQKVTESEQQAVPLADVVDEQTAAVMRVVHDGQRAKILEDAAKETEKVPPGWQERERMGLQFRGDEFDAFYEGGEWKVPAGLDEQGQPVFGPAPNAAELEKQRQEFITTGVMPEGMQPIVPPAPVSVPPTTTSVTPGAASVAPAKTGPTKFTTIPEEMRPGGFTQGKAPKMAFIADLVRQGKTQAEAEAAQLAVEDSWVKQNALPEGARVFHPTRAIGSNDYPSTDYGTGWFVKKGGKFYPEQKDKTISPDAYEIKLSSGQVITDERLFANTDGESIIELPAEETKPASTPSTETSPAGSSPSMPAEGMRKTSAEEYKKQGGWKLHLAVKPENYTAVDNWLSQNSKWAYKHLSGGEPGESDFTIYIGSKDDASSFAAELETAIGDVIERNKPPTDAYFTEKVAGRFDVQRTGSMEQVPWQYYGYEGVPFDEEAASMTMGGSKQTREQWVELAKPHKERIERRLIAKYGERYTGSAKADPQAEARRELEFYGPYRAGELQRVRQQYPLSPELVTGLEGAVSDAAAKVFLDLNEPKAQLRQDLDKLSPVELEAKMREEGVPEVQISRSMSGGIANVNSALNSILRARQGLPANTAATPTPPKPQRRMRMVEREVVGDILDVVEDYGGLMSATRAREELGSEWWDQNQSLYNDVPKLSSPLHSFIYRSGTGQQGNRTPDQIVADLVHDRLRPPDYSVSDLWAEIGSSSKSRHSMHRQRAALAASQREQEKQAQAFGKATAKGTRPVTTFDAEPGDVIDIEGEPVRVLGAVISFDPTRNRAIIQTAEGERGIGIDHAEPGDFILEDGKRFGRQRLPEGKVIYAEKIERARPAEDEGEGFGRETNLLPPEAFAAGQLFAPAATPVDVQPPADPTARIQPDEFESRLREQIERDQLEDWTDADVRAAVVYHETGDPDELPDDQKRVVADSVATAMRTPAEVRAAQPGMRSAAPITATEIQQRAEANPYAEGNAEAAATVKKNAPPERRRSIFLGKHGKRNVEFDDFTDVEAFSWAALGKKTGNPRTSDSERKQAYASMAGKFDNVKRQFPQIEDGQLRKAMIDYNAQVTDIARTVDEDETFTAPPFQPNAPLSPPAIDGVLVVKTVNDFTNMPALVDGAPYALTDDGRAIVVTDQIHVTQEDRNKGGKSGMNSSYEALKRVMAQAKAALDQRQARDARGASRPSPTNGLATTSARQPSQPDANVKEQGIGYAVLRFLNAGSSTPFITRRRKKGEDVGNTRKVTSVESRDTEGDSLKLAPPVSDTTNRQVVAVHTDGSMTAIDLGNRRGAGGIMATAQLEGAGRSELTHGSTIAFGQDIAAIVVVDDTGELGSWGGGTMVKVYHRPIARLPDGKPRMSAAPAPQASPVYRETNAYQALPFIDENSTADLSAQDVFLASSPELALGQGDNRGILLTFDGSRLSTRPNSQKPGTGVALEIGNPTELLGNNRQEEYQSALTSFEFNPADMRDASGRRLLMVARQLESRGWTKTQNGDRVRYDRPAPTQARMSSAGRSVPGAVTPSAVSAAMRGLASILPNVATAWSGTRAQLVQTLRADPEFQRTWKDHWQEERPGEPRTAANEAFDDWLELGLDGQEGFTMGGRTYLITDQIAVTEQDGTPSMAVRRVLIHEDAHEALDHLRNLDPEVNATWRQFRNAIPAAELDRLADQLYPHLKDWRSDSRVHDDLAHEWMAAKIADVETRGLPAPDSLIGRFLSWLKGVWQTLMGSQADPDTQALLEFMDAGRQARFRDRLDSARRGVRFSQTAPDMPPGDAAADVGNAPPEQAPYERNRRPRYNLWSPARQRAYTAFHSNPDLPEDMKHFTQFLGEQTDDIRITQSLEPMVQMSNRRLGSIHGERPEVNDENTALAYADAKAMATRRTFARSYIQEFQTWHSPKDRDGLPLHGGDAAVAVHQLNLMDYAKRLLAKTGDARLFIQMAPFANDVILGDFSTMSGAARLLNVRSVASHTTAGLLTAQQLTTGAQHEAAAQEAGGEENLQTLAKSISGDEVRTEIADALSEFTTTTEAQTLLQTLDATLSTADSETADGFELDGYRERATSLLDEQARAWAMQLDETLRRLDELEQIRARLAAETAASAARPSKADPARYFAELEKFRNDPAGLQKQIDAAKERAKRLLQKLTQEETSHESKEKRRKRVGDHKRAAKVLSADAEAKKLLQRYTERNKRTKRDVPPWKALFDQQIRKPQEEQAFKDAAAKLKLAPDTADRLFDLADDIRIERRTRAKAAAAQRRTDTEDERLQKLGEQAAKEPAPKQKGAKRLTAQSLINSIATQILQKPLSAQQMKRVTGQDVNGENEVDDSLGHAAPWNREYVAQVFSNAFVEHGVPRAKADEMANKLSGKFDQIMRQAQVKAATKAARNLNVKEQTIAKISAAIRSAAIDPMNPNDVVKGLAEAAGFSGLTAEDFQTLARLDAQIQDSVPTLAAKATAQMQRILARVKAPKKWHQVVEQLFINGALSSLGVLQLNWFHPGYVLPRMLMTDLAGILGDVATGKGKAGRAETMKLAGYTFTSLFHKRHAMIASAIFSMKNDAYTNKLQELLNSEHSLYTELMRSWEKLTNGTVGERAIALPKVMWLSSDWVRRILSSADQMWGSVIENYVLENEAMRQLVEKAGLTTELAALIVKQAYTEGENAEADHFEKTNDAAESKLVGRDVMRQALSQALDKKLGAGAGAEALQTGSQTYQMELGNRRGEDSPWFDVMNPALEALKGMASSVRATMDKFGIPLGRAATGFVSVAANILNRAVYLTPAGLARVWFKTSKRFDKADQKKWYSETMANDAMIRARFYEALTSTMLMGLLALLRWKWEDEEDYFAITGSGPQNKGVREAWLKQGHKPGMLEFRDGSGNVMVALPYTRGGFDHAAIALTFIGALDDLELDGHKMGEEQKNWGWAYAQQIGGNLLKQAQFFGIRAWAGSVPSSDKPHALAGQAGYLMNPFTPWGGLTKSVTKLFTGAQEQGSPQSAFLSNVPVVQLGNRLIGGEMVAPRLNYLGDQIGGFTDNIWKQIGERASYSGFPFYVAIAPTNPNSDIYDALVRYGIAPAMPLRSALETENGFLDDAVWADYVTRRGAIIKTAIRKTLPRLGKMTPDERQSFMSTISREATSAVKKQMKLK